MPHLLLLLALVGAADPPMVRVDCGRDPFTNVHRYIEFEEYTTEVWITEWSIVEPQGYGFGLGYLYDVERDPAEWIRAANHLVWLQEKYPRSSFELQILVERCLGGETKRAVKLKPERPSKPDKRTELTKE